jgi:hypothetical protein
MNNEYENDRRSVSWRMAEIADILAAGCMRRRNRRLIERIADYSENSLDDVAPSARLQTTENRTLEKGERLA